MHLPTKTIPCLLTFAFVALLPTAPARADVGPEPEPVEIISPTDGQVFYDAPVSLDVTVATVGIEEFGGTPIEVKLFIDGQESASDTEAPWIFEDVEFVEGAYTLHAVAVTDEPYEFTSPTVGIVVFSGPAPETTGDESGSESGDESGSESGDESGSESSSGTGSESSSSGTGSESSSGSGDDASTEGSTKAGCGCHSDADSGLGGGLFALGLLGLGLTRRRRVQEHGIAQ